MLLPEGSIGRNGQLLPSVNGNGGNAVAGRLGPIQLDLGADEAEGNFIPGNRGLMLVPVVAA
ncbi:hypothetical protein D3C87_2115560 [compost metagenome]